MGTRARCLSACVVVAAVLALAVTPGELDTWLVYV